MAPNQFEQRESREQESKISQEFLKDLELLKNFKEAKEQTETVPVIREIAKNNAELETKDLFDILNAKQSPEKQEKLKVAEKTVLDFDNLPELKVRSDAEELFIKQDTEEREVSETITGNLDIKKLANSVPNSLVSKLYATLDLSLQEKDKLREIKKNIVDNFPFTPDYVDSIAREIKMSEAALA